MEIENENVCKKVSSMLSLFIDDRVSINEKIFIEEHLKNCVSCRKKYMYLKSLIKNLKESYRQVVALSVSKQKRSGFSIHEHQKFMSQISPYVDNELEGAECFEFRKYLMQSKSAQKELKNTYIIQKLLKSSYNQTLKKTPQQISSMVMAQINTSGGFFDSVILKQIFTMKTAKIAILAGLMFICGYEFKQYDTPLKPKIKHTIEEIIDKNNYIEPFADDYQNYETNDAVNR